MKGNNKLSKALLVVVIIFLVLVFYIIFPKYYISVGRVEGRIKSIVRLNKITGKVDFYGKSSLGPKSELQWEKTAK